MDRFWAKVEKTDGCWWWRGALTGHGYGSFRVGKKMPGAHRVAWELLRGPIPKGQQIDHLCRNRACVNPDHMEVVSPAINYLRGHGVGALNARKTRCKRGHEFTAANTITDPGGGRHCRTCRKATKAAWRAAREAAGLPYV